MICPKNLLKGTKMATPRNPINARHREVSHIYNKIKGLPRKQPPPGDKAWRNATLVQEAIIMAMADESVHQVADAIFAIKVKKGI